MKGTPAGVITSSQTDKLMSLSDLIKRDTRMPSGARSPGYHGGLLNDGEPDTERTAVKNSSNSSSKGASAAPGAVGTQEALQAAEHGNSALLEQFLQGGGSPHTASKLHYMRWSLLHLAAG